MSGGRKPDVCREKAVAALVETGSIRDAARAARMGERTLKTWLAEDEGFRALYAEARRRLLDDALFLLQRSARLAVGALLREAAQGSDPALRVKASVALLDQVLRVQSHMEFEARMRAVEERLKGAG